MKLKAPKITKKSLALAISSPDPLSQAAAHKFLRTKKAKVKVSGDGADFIAEPAVQRYLGENKLRVGFSLKSVVKSVKKVVKKVEKAAPSISKLASAAKTIGPMVSAVYPAAGAAISSAGALSAQAAAGVKSAQDSIDAIKNAGGIKAQILDIAETAMKTKTAQDLISAAKSGVASATEKLNQIKEAAARGIPEAVASLKVLADAAQGLNAQPGQPIPMPITDTLGQKDMGKTLMIAGGALVVAGAAYVVTRKK
jgi:hypothetical protein